MSYVNKDRRIHQWRILQLSPETFVMILKGLCKGDMMTARGLPEDVEVAGVFLDTQQHRVGIYLDSEDFDPVGQGAQFPLLNVQITNISEQTRMAGLFSRKPTDS